MKTFISFLVGLAFAFGLGLSGMSQPQTIDAFLNLSGDWSYHLLVVMVSAFVVYGLLLRLILKQRQKPILTPRFMIPTNRQLTVPLIAGSAIFGLGLGLTGVCPGPALTTLNTGDVNPIFFVLTMIFGMWLYGQYNAFQQQRQQQKPQN